METLFQNIEVKPSIKDASQMIWTRNYVSETQCYESQNIFLLYNPLIEDQFSNIRGA